MTVIVNKLADYSGSFVDFDAPIDMTGVTGFFVLGISAERSIINHGSGPDATIVGTPTYTAQHARLTGPGSYIQTALTQSTEMSLVVVGKASVAAPTGTVRPCYIGNAVESGQGLTVYAASGVADSFVALGGVTAQAITSITDHSAAHFLASRVANGTGTVRQKNYTNGIASAPAAVGAISVDSKTFRLGMNYGTNLLGPADMSLAVIATRQFSDAEELALYNWAKALMALRGVAI